MSVSDIIKKSFLNQFNSELSTADILTVLTISALVGVYIFFIYRFMCRKAFYSKNFAISLTAITMITASIIITVQSSVVISLGMVGALSIVRFRTAIKDPMDLVFLFWAIGVGIMCGASLFEVAIEASLLLTIIIFILHLVPNVKTPVLLIVNANNPETENEIEKIIKENTTTYKIKSRNLTACGLDMIIELKSKNESELIKKVYNLKGIKNVTIMEHDGEITY